MANSSSPRHKKIRTIVRTSTAVKISIVTRINTTKVVDMAVRIAIARIVMPKAIEVPVIIAPNTIKTFTTTTTMMITEATASVVMVDRRQNIVVEADIPGPRPKSKTVCRARPPKIKTVVHNLTVRPAAKLKPSKTAKSSSKSKYFSLPKKGPPVKEAKEAMATVKGRYRIVLTIVTTPTTMVRRMITTPAIVTMAQAEGTATDDDKLIIQ